MLLTVCIEAGRQTLTHTSWTGLRFGSRKWMSGQVAALAARDDRLVVVELHRCPYASRPVSSKRKETSVSS